MADPDLRLGEEQVESERISRQPLVILTSTRKPRSGRLVVKAQLRWNARSAVPIRNWIKFYLPSSLLPDDLFAGSMRGGSGVRPGRMTIGVGEVPGWRVGAGVGGGVSSSSGVEVGEGLGRGVCVGVGVRRLALMFVLMFGSE